MKIFSRNRCGTNSQRHPEGSGLLAEILPAIAMTPASAQNAALARQLPDPVAALIRFPFQFNFDRNSRPAGAPDGRACRIFNGLARFHWLISSVRFMGTSKRLVSGLLLALLAVPGVAAGQSAAPSTDTGRTFTPDLRDADLPAAGQKGNFVIAPIPFSNPTLETGLIAGVGYFHPQTEEQASSQPASATGFGVMYSTNGSYGAAVGHSGYWKEDRWRFTGALAYADIELPLLALGENAELLDIEWLIDGTLLYSSLSRRIARHWFVGVAARSVNVNQDFQIDLLSLEFDLRDSFVVRGLGLNLTFDTRDMPTNAYEGRYFRATSLSNSKSLGSDLSYDSYSVNFRAYHRWLDSLVLAWELNACDRSDGVPLWDACTIGLRGFASTDYMGKSSVRGQVEARWKFSQRWGVVAFAGSGRIEQTFSGLDDGKWVSSYGLGLRFMIQQEKRINLRLDYARSADSDGINFFVGEAF